MYWHCQVKLNKQTNMIPIGNAARSPYCTMHMNHDIPVQIVKCKAKGIRQNNRFGN